MGRAHARPLPAPGITQSSSTVARSHPTGDGPGPSRRKRARAAENRPVSVGRGVAVDPDMCGSVKTQLGLTNVDRPDLSWPSLQFVGGRRPCGRNEAWG